MLKKPGSFINNNILFRIYKISELSTPIIPCRMCIFHNTCECPYEIYGYNCRQFDNNGSIFIPSYYVIKKI